MFEEEISARWCEVSLGRTHAPIEETVEEDVVAWAEKRLGFMADEKQAGFLRSRARRGILNCTRQWGKSTVTAIKALHTALLTSNSLILVMSPSKRQSGEFLRKVEELVRLLSIPVKRDGVNELSLLLPNRSRIVGLPGVEATMRGFSGVDLLIFDEAARVRDAQYNAAGAVLAVKNAPMWLLSTPYGATGFFWREWEQGGEQWERIRVTAAECARISPEFLESEHQRIGAEWFRQEYCCEFNGSEGRVFKDEWFEGIWVEAPELQ